MVVTYVAGNRAIGTNAERLALNSPYLASGVGGWKELGRVSGTTDPLSVTSLANKRYYMLLNVGYAGSGNAESYIYLNNDTGTNFANRSNYNGGADGTETSVAWFRWGEGATNNNNDRFTVGFLSNYSTKEKLGIYHEVQRNTAGAGNSPNRFEGVGKWTNTTNAISSIYYGNRNGTDWGTGTEMVVLGWDPADTHTTNFWTELASTTLSSTASTIDSGTIPAKKYLWIQAFVKQASTYTVGLQFNSDNTSSYAIRYSGNGGADGTSINTWKCASNYSSFGGGMFLNAFIINNQSKEKLVISHTNEVDTTGAGAASNRIEMVGKWANTSNQITSIQLRKETGTGDLQSGTIMKVWGSN